jgi:hypothetical protein
VRPASGSPLTLTCHFAGQCVPLLFKREKTGLVCAPLRKKNESAELGFFRTQSFLRAAAFMRGSLLPWRVRDDGAGIGRSRLRRSLRGAHQAGNEPATVDQIDALAYTARVGEKKILSRVFAELSHEEFLVTEKLEPPGI